MKKLLFAVFLIILSTFLIKTSACTGIRLLAENGDVIFARTMEWGAFELHSRITVIPPGYTFTALTPDGPNGKKYTTKYGIIGLDIVNKNILADGMNEKGLTVGMLYHPRFAEYTPYNKSNAKNSVSAQELTNYILASFTTIEEVKEGIKNIVIVGVGEESLGIVADCHWMVTDPSGKSIVIECTDQQVKIYDASLGVLTNSPNYDWHLTNIRNYLNLSGLPAENKELSGTKYTPIGAGSGLLGLPGDNTPPSRFIRAVAWTQTARELPNGKEAIHEAFRILDNFQLPLEPELLEVYRKKTGDMETMRSSTQYTVAYDIVGHTLNFHTEKNRRVRQINMNEIDFTKIGKDIVHLKMDESDEDDILDITPEL